MKISRRTILKASAPAIVTSALPLGARADDAKPEKLRAAIKEYFGREAERSERVGLTIPALSENGYSVSMIAEAQSDMTADDYVKQIAIFSSRNPIPLIAAYHFTPASGRAKVSSRIRLGGTQTVYAIAELSDGKLLEASTKTIVTVAACVVL